MWRIWLICAAVHGFLSVALGAFGAHGLKDRLEQAGERMAANFETGARYEMYHALALIGVAFLAFKFPSKSINASGYCMTIGACIFSFSLYTLALTGIKKFGAITPIGGVLLLAGWVLLAYAAYSANKN
jgi:uncharacterized membrane protein YgdD (TMEM256/DUF423 family)